MHRFPRCTACLVIIAIGAAAALFWMRYRNAAEPTSTTRGTAADTPKFREIAADDGNLKFVDVTEQMGVALADRICVGATFADYDNDGDQDLYVTSNQ